MASYNITFNTTGINIPDKSTPSFPDTFHGQTVIPCAIVSAGLATLFVGCRFYTRGVILRRLGKEDWFILVSLLFTLGSMAGTILMIECGLGRHYDWLTRSEVKGYQKARFFTNILYTVSLTFTKISILCLYLRVFKYEHIHAAAKILLGIVIISHTYIICDLLTTCIPLNAVWDMGLQRNGTAYCHDAAVYWSNFGLHVATDFLIFLLPLPVISKLRIPPRQKIGVFAVFLLAFAVCAISASRMVLFLLDTKTPKDRRLDITYQTVGMANWSMIEISASIVCACLTTLKPLVVRLFPGFSSGPAGGRGGGGAGGGHHDPWGAVDERDEVFDRPLTIGTKPSRDRDRERSQRSLRSLVSLRSQVQRDQYRERDRRDSFASYEGFVAEHKEVVDSPSPSPDLAGRPSFGGVSPFSPVGGMEESTREGGYRVLDLEAGLATPTSARMKPPPSPAEPPVYMKR